MDHKKIISTEVKAFRTAEGLSQSALAERIGVTKSEISYLEAGRHLPNVLTLLKLRAQGLDLLAKLEKNSKRKKVN